MNMVPDYFSSMVFDENTMRQRLPKDAFAAVERAIHDGKRLDLAVANVVANAMKDWAIEKGATHFTHWFQPMTGVTAEKHDSFISPMADGSVIMEFSGKELVRGESDASSFPSGGLRSTFEARGYTAWDPTSFAFIKGKTLCVPTAFCSYGGEALDMKTPLLRSMEAINKQAMRVIRLFGNSDVTSVKTTVGPEQEYFIITKEMFDRRKDLIYTGRTLFGARPPKGQELDDHYFGILKPRIAAFMQELDEELWKLGILAKTEHNEAAPAQHELAPVFTTANIATDHNQLTMEMMQKIARKHDLVCLLHEKPFAYVNGSGKHDNWSIVTNTGKNLLEPGTTPAQNAQFLLFLCAVIQAVDDYQDLLRISVASAGNDHRLGANEAPPAVVSIFLGDELNEILESIVNDTSYDGREMIQMKVGVHVLPTFPKDTTDRNRTSPFAFTGNKFEFRMLGSSASVAGANTMLNTAVAESLRQYADILEKADDFESTLHALIKNVIAEHKQILFNGNGYDESWIREATEERGLLNLRTTPEALPYLMAEKNIELFATHRIFTETEVRSRYEIFQENYCKTVNIEAQTMIDMVQKDYLPAISSYLRQMSETVLAKKSALPGINCRYEEETIRALSASCNTIFDQVKDLSKVLDEVKKVKDLAARSLAFKDRVIGSMEALRRAVDEAEPLTSKAYWPVPSYGDMLFSVK